MTSIPRFNVSSRYTRTKEDSDDSRNIRDINRADSSRTAGSNGAAASADSTGSDNSRVQLGFANLPDQMHRKAVKKGFNFTLMVVGESGLGKSTLINSLFQQDLYKDRELGSVTERINKTTEIEKRYIELDEKGVKLRLTVVDTPGFNDCINCQECWRPIEDYIDNTFEQYFKDECGLNRKNIIDHRVHCCLYFISPYGHGLRPIDVEFMRRLHGKVNIVPIIAKSDTLTSTEVRELKERVMGDLERHKIQIYRMPETDSDDDEETRVQESEIRACIPFAAIGSNCVVESGETGRRVRGRQYPWGVVEVENPRHCDFTKLRIFLLGTHMQDLKDITKEVHYENYRAKYITERMTKRKGPREEMETRKSKNTSDAQFEALVDTEGLLKEKEDEIRRMQQLLQHLQSNKSSQGGSADGSGPPTSSAAAAVTSANSAGGAAAVSTTATSSGGPTGNSSGGAAGTAVGGAGATNGQEAA
uniref:Septin-type G domain-containing protein n=1 Tax=Macrostomum lignano TaxID=282301 RepID=A0A1I8GF88_9PLAT